MVMQPVHADRLMRMLERSSPLPVQGLQKIIAQTRLSLSCAQSVAQALIFSPKINHVFDLFHHGTVSPLVC